MDEAGEEVMLVIPDCIHEAETNDGRCQKLRHF